jgi:hypothetical protein
MIEQIRGFTEMLGPVRAPLRNNLIDMGRPFALGQSAINCLSRKSVL